MTKYQQTMAQNKTTKSTGGKLSLQDSSSVLTRKTEIVYPIKDSEWSELKVIVKEKDRFDSLPLNIFFVCVGVLASAITAIFTMDNPCFNNKGFVFLLILSSSAILMGVVMLVFHNKVKKREIREQNRILNKMERLESLFDK